ncbi:E2 [Gammapapillomavirus sp.]|uniref:E2 n=1 Tax=Gammapapillomavirus sp. TaxID=2049444 RepID=UPI000C3DC5EE|nr:E2 [Gammapapillomavirus sp.]ATQ38171.1 E2 [Gammapapillomavirus sp.]
MNQADLTKRFDVLQEKLMELYESGENTLEAQIEHWRIIRKQYVLMYYSRKEGYKNLGLQPLPTLQTSEYKAKEAIQQLLLLESLQRSPFKDEEWSLSDTSAELTLTPPRNTFKKSPYIVDVWFDNDPKNSFPYTQWNRIYYQDDKEQWRVAEGKADINGLFYDDYTNERNYFLVFAPDVDRFSKTGQWTVKVKNETISSVTSSQRQSSTVSVQGSVTSSRDAVTSSKTFGRDKGKEGSPSSTTPSTPDLRRRRRRREQGESSPRRRTKRLREVPGFGVPASEVGRRPTTVPTRGLRRIERLAAEARDPPIIIVKGGANNLKCFRNRHKNSSLFDRMSTVFRWAGDSFGNRMLISFISLEQRSMFLNLVHLPKDCTYSLGSLESL